MPAPLLATKLYIQPPPRGVVPRPRLIERLNEGLSRKLSIIAAPAGFGKTTLVSAWAANAGLRVAWLSLDEGDSDPALFLAYLVAALRTVASGIGVGISGALQSSQPPPTEVILAALLNEIVIIESPFVIVLDDYHLVDAAEIDRALTFLLDRLPAQMHLVITTRENPQLPLARMRARGQLCEVRAGDLRFTPFESAALLNDVMGLDLSADAITAHLDFSRPVPWMHFCLYVNRV